MSDLRVDMDARLRPAIRYLPDTQVPGCLTARVLRSPHPHALIRSIDTSAARALPGVFAVLTAADMPQGFLYGLRLRDRPILATDRVRLLGEAVAAVAATDARTAERAIRAIVVDYAPLAVLDTPQVALGANAPALHPGGNLCHARHFTRGNVDAALAGAAHVVRHTLITPRQAHAAIELEGGVAVPLPDGAEVFAPSQHPHGVRDIIAAALGPGQDQVVVHGSPIGGSYGGKEDLHEQVLLAFLARKADRPVRLVRTRAENMAVGYKRHPFEITMETGCDSRGRLVAHRVRIVADNGAYASHGPEVLDTAHECAQGPYAIENAEITSQLIYTNNGIGGAFRGFGAVQVQCAIEMQMDALADRVGLDPATMRRINLPAADAPGPLGTRILPRPETAEVARLLAGYPVQPPQHQGRFITARGIALVQKGEGFAYGAAEAAQARLRLMPDGRIRVDCALCDMGQGVHEAARTVFAHQLGVGVQDLDIHLGTTDQAPDAGPTSASRGTQVMWRLGALARTRFMEQLLHAAALARGRRVADLSPGPGGVWDGRNLVLAGLRDLAQTGDFDTTVHIGQIDVGPLVHGAEAHPLMTTCGAVADVRADTVTGAIQVQAMTLLPACGRVVVSGTFNGQVAGGAVMGMGMVVMEDQPYVGGVPQALNLDSYLVPTLADAPPVTTIAVPLAPDDPVGLRGVGEIATNAAAPAVLCALRRVLGQSPARLPVTPEQVLASLQKGMMP